MSATSPASQTTRVTLKHIRFISEPASLAAASALSEAPGKVLMTFVDPFACTAVVTEASPAEIETSDGAASAPDLAVLLVPEGTPDQAQWQRKARQWVEAGDGPAPIRIVVDEDASILWRPGRAVIIAPAGAVEGLCTAVVDFAHYERQLRALESEIAADWPLAEKHMPLVHAADKATLKKSGDLGIATLRAVTRRMRYARLEPHLFQAPEAFRNLTRTAARRLRTRTGVESRLEAADAHIEVFEDLYDMANQRTGEHFNFIREYRLEFAILAVLGAELILMVIDVYLNYMAYFHQE